MDNPKSLIIKLSAGFLGALLFLTFFSTTLSTLNLPGVVVGSPVEGIVVSTYRSYGDVEFAEIETVFAEDGGRINFAVGVGDRVEHGDVLFTIETDRQELRDRLEDEQSRLEAALINLARARGDLAFEQSRLAQLVSDSRASTIHYPDITRFEHEARRLETEIERAEAEHQANTLMFAAGGISRSQLDNSAHVLNQLRENYARNAEEMDIVLQNHARAEEQHLQTFETEHSSLLHRIDTLGYSIRLLELEEADRRRSLRRLHDQVEADGIATFYAESDGIIREIPAGLESGVMVQRNQIIMRYAFMHGEQFIIKADFPERIGAIHLGSEVRINVPSVNLFRIQGDILRTSTSGGRLRMEVAFETDIHINGGERAEILLELLSNANPDEVMRRAQNAGWNAAGLVLPNSAIRRDGAGLYIMYLEREPNTMLGHSYYAQQMRIQVTHEGDRFTLFEPLGQIEGPVVITSDRPFWQGSRVRIVGDE